MTTIAQQLFAAPRDWFPNAILMNHDTLTTALREQDNRSPHFTLDPKRPGNWLFCNCTPIHVHDDIKSWAFTRCGFANVACDIEGATLNISHWKLHRATGWTIVYEPGADQ